MVLAHRSFFLSSLALMKDDLTEIDRNRGIIGGHHPNAKHAPCGLVIQILGGFLFAIDINRHCAFRAG